MDGEMGVGAAQTCYEMIFECADGMFSCIMAMDMWWYKLEVNGFGCPEFLEGARGFIVQALEIGAEAHGAKPGMATLVCLQYGVCLACLECFCEDGIAVVVIND